MNGKQYIQEKLALVLKEKQGSKKLCIDNKINSIKGEWEKEHEIRTKNVFKGRTNKRIFRIHKINYISTMWNSTLVADP